MAKNRAHFDVIVNGSNLSGLLIAYHWAKQGKSVLVLEEMDDIGRTHYSPSADHEIFKSSLELLPSIEGTLESVQWAESLFDQPMLQPSFEQTVKTYKDAKHRDFVGFGDIKFQSADDLHWFSQSKVQHFSVSPWELIERILDFESIEVAALSKVNKYNSKDGRVESVTVNSTKTFSADLFYHCEPLFILDRMMTDNKVLTGKEKTAFSKTEGWTLASLQLIHRGQVSEDFSAHIFHGSKNDFEPMVGRFFPAEGDETKVQASIWETFIHPESAEDMEYIGGSIRNMKKILKRAFPECIDDETSEKIQVTPNGVGRNQGVIAEPHRIQRLENLVPASPLTSEQKDLGAFFEAAKGDVEISKDLLEAGEIEADQ